MHFPRSLLNYTQRILVRNLPHKKAFTMIELILVIIIIGILAGVAIPRLAATSDDSKIVTMIANTRAVLGNLGTYYTTVGPNNWKSAKLLLATNVPLETTCGTPVTTETELSPIEFVFCNGLKECLVLNTEDDGSLTISAGDDSSDMVCREVLLNNSTQIMLKKFYLGGKRVIR